MTVLFDLDDTLLDHTSACVAGAVALYERVQPGRSLDDFVAASESSLRRQFDRYLAGELSYDQQSWERVREVVDRSLSDAVAAQVFSTYLDAYEAGWELFPDVEAALTGHRLGIVTNGQSEQQRRKIERTELLARVTASLFQKSSERRSQSQPSSGTRAHSWRRRRVTHCMLVIDTTWMLWRHGERGSAASGSTVVGPWVLRTISRSSNRSQSCQALLRACGADRG